MKAWSDEDQPREKLIAQGRKALSTAELMAILIGSGSKGESALALCQRLLNDHNQSLNQVAKLNVDELMSYKGIGEAKAISIIAALELSSRRKSDETKVDAITSSADAYNHVRPILEDLVIEEFWVLLLNRRNKVIRNVLISKGGVSSTVVDVRLILKPAIESLSSGIILVHNHPSGSLTPSSEDKKITKKIWDACCTFNISLLDHLIVSDSGYFSFMDEGLLS